MAEDLLKGVPWVGPDRRVSLLGLQDVLALQLLLLLFLFWLLLSTLPREGSR